MERIIGILFKDGRWNYPYEWEWWVGGKWLIFSIVPGTWEVPNKYFSINENDNVTG